MKDLFSIGELAKYQKISKQTLIYYDKIDLLTPAYVNPETGYRYYSAKQLDQLDTILVMKQLGFSLEEIREHMKDCNIENSCRRLEKQLGEIETRIQELQLIKSRICHKCERLKQAGRKPGAAGLLPQELPVTEPVEAQYILCQDVKPPFSMAEISIATKKCFADAFENQLPIYFQSGVIVPLERIRQERFTEASVAFLSIEAWAGKIRKESSRIKRLPRGMCASICHYGDYASIGRSYKKLLAYCEEKNLEICSNSYEFCINDYITSRDEKEYITKIVFYVKSCGQKGM